MTKSDLQWGIPPRNVRLSENEVHVWRAALEVSVEVLGGLQRLLSEEEVTRAQRFHFEKDRSHFIVAHGVLRIILGRYLNADPSQLRFCYNHYGKPSLDLPFDKSKLNFNLSHSHEIALYAFTYAKQIGIDVEHMRSDIEYERLAKHSFSLNEQAALHALPQALKQQAFFNCWTRKEAYIKARGTGLSLPLDLFDVSLRPGEPAVLLSSREDSQETVRWSLQDFDPGSGYAGALAVEGSGRHLSCWQWQSRGRTRSAPVCLSRSCLKGRT